MSTSIYGKSRSFVEYYHGNVLISYLISYTMTVSALIVPLEESWQHCWYSHHHGRKEIKREVKRKETDSGSGRDLNPQPDKWPAML